MKKRRSQITAEPLVETSSVPTETYPGVGYEPDNSVHAPKVPDVGRPKNPDAGFLKEPEGNAGADDMVLTQPMRYIVDPKDAIERMEALNRKVEESRPDLAQQVAVVDQAIQQLEQGSQGQNMAPAPEAQPEVPAFNEGDRVSVTLEDGVYEGMVEKANDDGTFAVRTDQAMTLQNVPATSMQKAEVEQMMLPASLLLRLKAARMVTDAIAKAFIEGKKRRIANTSTDGKTIWLHNNAIARKSGDGSVEISLAGWPTVTTRERLNGLLNALGINKKISQRAGSQMLDGKPWDGEWTNVGSTSAPEAPAPEATSGPELEAKLKAGGEVVLDDVAIGEQLEEEGPAPEDYMISDSGELGGMYSVSEVEGKFLGEFAEWDDMAKAIRDDMEKNQFWPNVWYVNDHGNVSLANVNAARISVVAKRVVADLPIKKGGRVQRFPGRGPVGEVTEEMAPSTVPDNGEYGRFKVKFDDGEAEHSGEDLVNVFEGEPQVKVGDEVMYRGWAWDVGAVDGDLLVLHMSGDPDVTEHAKQGQVRVMAKKVLAEFMEKQIHGPMDGVYVEMKSGGEAYFLPWFPENQKRDGEPTAEAVAKLIGSDVLPETVERVKGFFGRYSAPGYLDATDWIFGDTKEEVEAELSNIYGDDDEEIEASMKKKIKAKKVKAAEAKPTNTAQTGVETGKVKEGYEPTGIQVVEEGGKPRAFDQAKDDVVPAELYKNAEGKFALVNPNGENSYEEGANDDLELAYWASVKALAPAAAPAAAPAPEPAKTTEKPAEVKEAVAASAKATAIAAREKLKASKKAKEVKASAFDEIAEIEIGGGYKAKRKAGKKSEKEGEADEAAEIEVVDADGKVKATYPDAFGDDTVMIIKFLRQVLDIKEGDDKKAAKKDDGAKKEGGESDIAEKPKALPATKEETPKSESEKEEEQVQARRIEARLEDIRAIATRLLKTGHIQANLDDVDAGLVKGLTLAGAQAAAATKAVDRKVLDLLAQPEDELLLIKASLPLLPDRRAPLASAPPR